MTPDDMEAANRQLLIDLEKGRDKRAALDPVHAEFQRHIDALRALLLAYEERGQALEDLLALPVAKQAFVYLDKGIGSKTPAAAWLRARATLKGKSHD